jgi:phosphoenolpyruvate phosphomutase
MEAGAKALWVSSFTVSASLGMRDRNEVSTSQMIEVSRAIVESSNVPVIVDGDNGHGDFNNARLFTRHLERSSVAGVVFEDKTFPKQNSFWNTDHQLIDIATFQGMIKASKDIQQDPDFWVIARTEALIAGYDLSEALKRAHAYADAGADAIFIHSKKRCGSEILEFSREWNRRTPVVVAPTTYPDVSSSVLRASGVDIVIWANHLLRASIRAMQQAVIEILRTGNPVSIENRLASLDEVFHLTKVDEVAAIAKALREVGYSY